MRLRNLITRPFLAIALPLTVMLSLLAFAPMANAQSADFAISATPAGLCVNPGVNAKSVITIASLGGFSGRVNLADNVDPNVDGAPVLSSIPSSVILAGAHSVKLDLTISTTSTTPDRVFQINVYGASGLTFHQGTVQLVVSADCSVGGTILPVNRLGLVAPYIATATSILAVLGLGAAAIIYLTKARRDAKR